MPNNIKFSYSALGERFRAIARQDEIMHITVQPEPRYAKEVAQYLQVISKARRAVKDSKLVFKGRRDCR